MSYKKNNKFLAVWPSNQAKITTICQQDLKAGTKFFLVKILRLNPFPQSQSTNTTSRHESGIPVYTTAAKRQAVIST
jgi:hypothetical protein